MTASAVELPLHFDNDRLWQASWAQSALHTASAYPFKSGLFASLALPPLLAVLLGQ